MIRNFKVLFFLFLSFFSMAFADLEKYRLVVAEVDPDSHSFVLSNGMKFCKIASDKTATLPPVGIEAIIYPLTSSSEDKRMNREEGEFEIIDDGNRQFQVWMPKESEQFLLTVVSCRPKCVPGWLYPSCKSLIELSDGSKWTTDDHHFFAKGDRIIVSTDIDIGDWRLINVDMVLHLAAGAGTRYHSLCVEPYITKE